MKPTTLTTENLDALQREMRDKGEPFAVATVVRTMAATSAKAGSKAILNADGEIIEGWVGGGCVRGAIVRAAKTAISRNDPVFIALRPDDELKAEGVGPCEVRDGVVFERNGCASRGSLDIFVEAFVPSPELIILGDGPVAGALRTLARPFDFQLKPELPKGRTPSGSSAIYVVVATQGRGDAAALESAVAMAPAYLAFVGSRRKAASIMDKLASKGADQSALDKIVAPAGLDIGAATPEEIALSILAEIITVRRSTS